MKASRRSTKPAVTAAVLRLLKGCSIENFAWLCRNAEMYDSIYIVDHDPDVVAGAGASGCYAYNPEPGEVPWTVALLLGCHSRKHIFERPGRYPMTDVGLALRDFHARLKWSWVFRGSPDEPYEVPLVKRGVLPCKSPIMMLALTVCSVLFVRRYWSTLSCLANCYSRLRFS